MGVSGHAGVAPEQGVGRSAPATRALLVPGVVVGPFYLTVGLLQAFLREGFDLARHALSHLANGPGGWVQTANFLLSGLMVVAAAVAFTRVMGPRARVMSVLLGAFGVSMIVAAFFPADPVDGFPIGTPKGFPTSISTTGLVHFAVGALGFTCLGVSCLVAARVMSRRNARSLARLSLLSGLAVIFGFFGGFVLPNIFRGTAGIWFSVVVGWAWLSVMSIHVYRQAAEAT